MYTIDKVRERYLNDPMFHAIVDAMQSAILKLELTPSEMREAANFACILVEERRPWMLHLPYEPPTEGRR